jgi:hypothetical protein
MPTQIFTNNISSPERREAIRNAVLQGIGERSDCWEASIYEPPDHQGYLIIIEGPDGCTWTRSFLGPDEQRPESIRQAVEQALTTWQV